MYGIIIAFQDFNVFDGFLGSPFVGLKHFRLLFGSPYFYRIFRNTLLLGLFGLLWGFWPPIVLALLLNEVRSEGFKRTVQSVSYLPHFISTVIIVGMLFEFFASDGAVNQFLQSIGIPAQQFFIDPKWFRTLYISSGIWQGVGWGSIIYLASLAGIDVQLYEAAFAEGANRFQRMWHVTIPGILPAIIILFILNVRTIVTVGFEKVYLMYNPAIYETADVISTYVYRRGILNADYSYSTAVGLFSAVISFMIILAVNTMARKLGEISLW
jgi:putative aldouronate transport system permease protein